MFITGSNYYSNRKLRAWVGFMPGQEGAGSQERVTATQAPGAKGARVSGVSGLKWNLQLAVKSSTKCDVEGKEHDKVVVGPFVKESQEQDQVKKEERKRIEMDEQPGKLFFEGGKQRVEQGGKEGVKKEQTEKFIEGYLAVVKEVEIWEMIKTELEEATLEVKKMGIQTERGLGDIKEGAEIGIQTEDGESIGTSVGIQTNIIIKKDTKTQAVQVGQVKDKYIGRWTTIPRMPRGSNGRGSFLAAPEPRPFKDSRSFRKPFPHHHHHHLLLLLRSGEGPPRPAEAESEGNALQHFSRKASLLPLCLCIFPRCLLSATHLTVMASTVSAYKEKMKELSLLSLICSCFHTQPHPNTIYQYGDMEVKQLDKRASGQSFEVILKSPSDLSPESPVLSSPPRRGISPWRSCRRGWRLQKRGGRARRPKS
ncbi:hypothetical protein JRQ81_014387 [Phrynocephalus forsythii]|uniref:Uncharacterized protein n=1 Tax=Phrynocephalus forsythii TaxID=171643 RepID=A0A9Q1B2T1_9SAUR|nr:hypothetical protein JRQ81_014387 [Phrynocephalus forsythii]